MLVTMKLKPCLKSFLGLQRAVAYKVNWCSQRQSRTDTGFALSDIRLFTERHFSRAARMTLTSLYTSDSDTSGEGTSKCATRSNEGKVKVGETGSRWSHSTSTERGV